jgi:hypothetical protein
MSTYLDETFLGRPADLGAIETGSASNLPSVGGDPNRPPMPADDNVRLPGGIVIPRKTFVLIVGALVAIAIVWYLKSRKKD